LFPYLGAIIREMGGTLLWKERWAFAWQEGYGAFSVGPVQVPEVIKYIAGQKEHHRKISFQEDLISFLQKYGIEYDDRYIWK
jgi:hypothetical protein